MVKLITIALVSVFLFSCQSQHQSARAASQQKSTSEPLGPMAPSKLVDPDECDTSTLEIVLNKNNRTNKESLIKVMSVLAKAGRPVTLKVDDDDSESITVVTEFDPTSAASVSGAISPSSLSGWTSLQSELASLDGVSFACSKDRPSAASNSDTPDPSPTPASEVGTSSNEVSPSPTPAGNEVSPLPSPSPSNRQDIEIQDDPRHV
jgi:hypothetical protein